MTSLLSSSHLQRSTVIRNLPFWKLLVACGDISLFLQVHLEATLLSAMRKPRLVLVTLLVVAAVAPTLVKVSADSDEGISSANYGADVSYPMHHAHVTGDVLGTDKQQFYDDNMKGCFDYYDKEGYDGKEACLDVEHERIRMNLRQPQSMINYTKNGFVKIRAPENVWKLVQEFWKANREELIDEEWGVGYVMSL